MFTKLVWRYRIYFVSLLCVVLPFASITLIMSSISTMSFLVAILSLLRILNYLRIAKARMHNSHLLLSTSRTSLVFVVMQSVLIILGLYCFTIYFKHEYLIMLAGLQLILALITLLVTVNSIYATRYKQGMNFYSDKQLPTVSLLIPARNETEDLDECLISAISSDYPKLEIIVLDDCSHHKTSQIIKGYAHDGVRFVKGKEPNDRWLAKNQAYEVLSKEATGNILLFCGVDVRFGKSTIRALVTELLVRDKQMISVLPTRQVNDLSGLFIQPMRYWWELALPRKLLNRPPTLSTAWMIRKKSLESLGGFSSVSHNILPERIFARELVNSNDYSFIRSNNILNIQTNKSLKEQLTTAVRVRYPQLRRRPENVIAIVLSLTILLLGPYALLVLALTSGLVQAIIPAVSIALLSMTNYIIVKSTNAPLPLLSIVLLPLEIMSEIFITIKSMLKYEFGIVVWKDRNVCIPVMHVVPRLPELKD